MKQIITTTGFFTFMYLITSVYANAQGYYVDQYQQNQQNQQIQQQMQELQQQQQTMQRQQDQLQMQRNIDSINRGCVRSASGQEFC